MSTLKRIYDGLYILKLTAPKNLDPDGIWFTAEHDQIWCGDYSAHQPRMTEYKLARMEELGWFEDQGFWSHFT